MPVGGKYVRLSPATFACWGPAPTTGAPEWDPSSLRMANSACGS